MSTSTHHDVGLAHVVEALARRYRFDHVGRITGRREDDEGGTPRFVLGRAREGVVWRFRSDLDTGLVLEIARLAARETGFPIAGDRAQPPERLAAIVKRIDRFDRTRPGEGGSPQVLEAKAEGERASSGQGVRHHWVSHEAKVIGELWTIE